MKEEKFLKKIEEAKKIHNNKFSYEHTENPKTVKDYIVVTCPIHGDFKTTFDSHINKKIGCPACSGLKRRTNEEALNEIKNVHKNKNYSYEFFNFKNVKSKVTVVCHEKDILGREHGEFEIRYDHLKNGHGCPKCSHRCLTTEEVVEMAKEVHGDKYDYSLLEYHNNNSEKLPIICHEKDENGEEHGIFYPVWYSHLQGVGCPKCNGGIKYDREKFINNATKVHNGFYSYDKFVYVDANTPGIITCPRHGDFSQAPYQHANRMYGCPKCKSSKLEALVRYHLEKNNIFYEEQVKIGLGKQTIDFHLPKYGIYIECQGEQHYVPTKFSPNETDEDAEKNLIIRKKLDVDKYNECTKRNEKIIYFTLPNDFHISGVDIYADFYSDKNVFTNPTDLINFIIKGKQCNKKSNVFFDFVNDIKKINNNVSVFENKIKYNNIIIYFNYLNGKDSKNILERHRTSLRRGYKTIDVFEDEYTQHHDIVLSKLKHIMGLDENDVVKIDARKCIIKEIDNETAKKFLNKNHIQGYAKSTLYYGCYSKEELIAVMSFLKEDDTMWNLTRFATLIGTLCRGVGGKMFKTFVKNINPIKIKSFADKRWTSSKDNNLYIKLGFKYDSNCSKSEYRYYKEGETKERMHKFGFRKQTLSKKYGLPLTMTEKEMTESLGYVRIWDCGLFKYVWTNPDNEIKTETIIID